MHTAAKLLSSEQRILTAGSISGKRVVEAQQGGPAGCASRPADLGGCPTGGSQHAGGQLGIGAHSGDSSHSPDTANRCDLLVLMSSSFEKLGITPSICRVVGQRIARLQGKVQCPSLALIFQLDLKLAADLYCNTVQMGCARACSWACQPAASASQPSSSRWDTACLATKTQTFEQVPQGCRPARMEAAGEAPAPDLHTPSAMGRSWHSRAPAA